MGADYGFLGVVDKSVNFPAGVGTRNPFTVGHEYYFYMWCFVPDLIMYLLNCPQYHLYIILMSTLQTSTCISQAGTSGDPRSLTSDPYCMVNHDSDRIQEMYGSLSYDELS